MIVDSLRSLLYPLGFAANLLFGGRFMLQWIQSEKKGASIVTRGFWRLSFLANCLMCLHGYIQLQYPICVIQALNGTIAWRNLNLMGKRACRLRTMLCVMGVCCVGVTSLFFLQTNFEWMRPPVLPWSGKHAEQASLLWHLLGFFGIALFSSRYWIQWWLSEKSKRSSLGKSFWWISCIGALFSLTYAIRLSDPVNMISFSIGLIPYVRNLMLIRKQQQQLKTPKEKALFLFAGEQSGDVLGGKLVRALRTHSPTLNLYGVGGPEMREAGLTVTHPMERFQVMGFSDVFKALPRLYTDFRKIKKEILQEQPAAVVLIDYPEFNMLLAKRLRKKGYQGKVIHYVCPSVWAWRKNRVESLAKTLDHLLAILPFEGNCFAKTTLPVTYVGHPLIAAIDQHRYDSTWNFPKPLIALFPGSRRHEIALNLPIQLKAAQTFKPNYHIAISVARPELQEQIQSLAAGFDVCYVPCEKRYELMRAADAALATSGTIILELGLHSVPTVATYQLAPLNYLMGRYVFRIHLPFYTLVNIICEKEVFPEFIHKTLSAEEIASSLKQLLANSAACKVECARLRQLLKSHDASEEAAKAIAATLEARSR